MDSGWEVVEIKMGPNDGLAIVCPVCSQCPVWAKNLYIITVLLVLLVLYVLIKWFGPTHKIDIKQVKK